MRSSPAAILGFALLACGVADAAPVQPAWTRDFTAPIQWQRVTAFGQLLVSTAAGLYAVDPNTGTVAWSQRDLASLPAEGFKELAGSPLVLISDGAENPRTVVLNVFNGQLVFDSRAAGLGQISVPRILPRAGSLLVAGFEIGKPQPLLFLYAMEDGRQLWKSDVLGATMNPGGNALMSLLLSAALVMVDVDPVQSAPLELGDGTFLLGAMGHVMRLEQSTGKVQASAESRDFFFMLVQQENRSVTLSQVSKRDGRILGEIDLQRDKEPDYQIDDISSFVFYRPAESVITGYRFAPERIEVALQ